MSSLILSSFRHLITDNLKETKRNICGKKLGSGCFRDVYVLKQNPDYVVKIEKASSIRTATFCNVTEWRYWINNKDWIFLSEWLAPCELITRDGEILIQRRVYWNDARKKDYPKYIPVVFTDIKVTNYGWMSDGSFVACDYAFLNFDFTGRIWKYAKWKGTLHCINAGN